MKMMIDARVYISVIIVVMFARVSMCVPRHEDDENMKNLKKENQLRSKFKCGPPQPRIIYLHEIVGDEIWKTEYMDKMESVVPHGVVLHRCENSGCCPKYNERCKPTNETEVTLTFMITHKNSANTSAYDFRNHQAKNHTVCECQIISDKQIK